jgi:hypothetical protein
MTTDDKENRADGTCEGMEFYIDNFWRFVVPGLDKYFKSHDEMREAIEREGKKIAAAQKRKVSIAGITEKGVEVVVTGVHAGHGGLITSPKTDKHIDVYVNTPIAKAAREELRRLQSDVERVEFLLEMHKLNEGNYRTFNPSMHESDIRRIERVAEKAGELANKPFNETLAGIKLPSKKRLRF